jgi:DNA-binding IclR family transcriptional regulator
VALLVPESPAPEDRAELTEARRLGEASSPGEVIPGIRSIAAPVRGPDGAARAAVAGVFVDENVDVTRVGDLATAVAETVAAALR